MAEITLREMGWRTMNIGPDTPTASLGEAIDRHAPRLVWLSVTARDLPPTFFEHYPRLYERAHARGIGVAIGGQGVTRALQDRVVASAFGTRLAHLKAFAQSLGP
jgi:MerR family transcriptional regulator, light-induced transcriptional regulator